MEDIEDNDFVASEHDLLVNAISKLDKTQHISAPTRNEPSISNSEFNLSKRNKLDLSKVVKVLENTAHHVQISKKLRKSQDGSKILPKPLEKPQAERIKRATGYEETKKKVGRWDPVVARSRTVDFLSFPLKHVETKLQPTSEFLSRLELKSTLEKELEEIDPPATVEHEEEDEQTYPMSYEEMMEHRQRSAKLRAQQSYKAAKAKRQSKIKSKKYHRVLKKEKLKQQLKEFEELQKKNPEEALQKLEALEKARALERHTLRHKNTGKWAKNKLIRAKYDKEVRQQLADQLAVSRSLTHKTQNTESTDDEADDNEAIPDIALAQDPMNPWMMQRSDKSNVAAEFDFGYKKYLKEKVKPKDSDTDSSDEEPDNVNKESLNTLKESISRISQKEETPLEIEEYVIDKAAINRTIAETNKRSAKNQRPKKKGKVVATSNWIVEDINEVSEEKKADASEDVTTAFESFEETIADQVSRKLKILHANFEKLEKSGKAMDSKKRKKEEKEHDNLEYLKLKSKKQKAVIDEELIETDGKTPDGANNAVKTPAKILETAQKSAGDIKDCNSSNIDPNRFIQVKPKYLNTALSSGDKGDELDDEEQVVPKVNIEEVFEEDDVVASFRQEKEEEANKDKLEDIDLSLPGWGSWGGKGVKAPKRKKNRFILKAPPQMTRRDENKGDVIIKEYKDPKLASHKLTDVPFPFSTVKEYEASMRTPLGNTFIPETAHKKLIRPSVITKAGTIIDPMDEEELLVKRNRNFKNADVINILAKNK